MNRITPRKAAHFLLAWFACVCVAAFVLRLWSPESLERVTPDGTPIPGAISRLVAAGLVVVVGSAALAFLHARKK
jgi:hypothetical protein